MVIQFISTEEAEGVRSAVCLAYHDLSAKIVEVLIEVLLTFHGCVCLHDDLRMAQQIGAVSHNDDYFLDIPMKYLAV